MASFRELDFCNDKTGTLQTLYLIKVGAGQQIAIEMNQRQPFRDSFGMLEKELGL
jgi:hypothetical protein